MSLDGDGQMDLVLLGPANKACFERKDPDAWKYHPFRILPTFDWTDPNLRFIDLDGDGLADVLITQDHAFLWSRSLGRDGFDRPMSTPKPRDENAGPAVVFSDATESIFLADMTGDGLVDIVRVRNGEICYWPNLGYARFGAKVTMGNAPHFDRQDLFDPKRLRFGDVDGSGTSDIAYLRADGVVLYLNQSGNRWSEPTVIRGLSTHFKVSVDLIDLLGTGTACLV
jgi:hypothetical protein